LGVFFEPVEDRWHGAAPKILMNHIANQQQDESGNVATLGEDVRDDEYKARAAS